MLEQLNYFLKRNNILDRFQSGFRAGHSTESALLRVSNDILRGVDSGSCVVLLLLDLTAAFDTVDHDILIARLKNHVGVQGLALKWFSSYLKDRTFSVSLGDYSSPTAPLVCGVPQGSILGPILFSLYMLPLSFIFEKFGIHYHVYADDSQIYLPLKQDHKCALQSLHECLTEVKCWLTNNFLQLNEDKTEMILFGNKGYVNDAYGCLGQFPGKKLSCVKNLGVIFDSELKFDRQVNAVVKNSFFHLRSISKLKSILSFEDMEKVVHAFVSSRLDYCNVLYLGLNQLSLSRLQLVQNSAARLLTGTRGREHITPVLIKLHWLPIRYRIHYKVLLYVFKAVHGLSPDYVTDLINVYQSSRSLRSNDQLLLMVPRSRLKCRGDRAFSVAAPRLWNALPLSIRSSPTLGVFQSALKTHLFSLAFENAF